MEASGLPALLVETTAHVAWLTAELTQAKAWLQQVQQDTAEWMYAEGYTDCFHKGTLIVLKEQMTARINKEDQPAAYAYLTQQGASSLIKRQVTVQFGLKDMAIAESFERMAKVLFPEFPITITWEGMDKEPIAGIQKIQELAEIHFKGRKITTKDVVPPATLKKYVKEQIARGVELPEFFHAYHHTVAMVQAEEEPESEDF